MSKAMVEQQGLLNHAQAGLFLEVSTKRISELVRLGKLTRFDFVGRICVSYKEVRARRERHLKAGRPPRRIGKRVLPGLQAVANLDLPLAVMEGLTDHEINEATSKEQINEPES